MYGDALQCSGCLSMLSDVLDVYRWSTMSWMYVDTDRCSRCLVMLSDVLDVCWFSPMSWMYIDDHRCPGCILTSWFIAQNFYSRCTLTTFDSYLLICHEIKKPLLTTRNPKNKGNKGLNAAKSPHELTCLFISEDHYQTKIMCFLWNIPPIRTKNIHLQPIK